MRMYMYFFLTCAASALLLSGCGTAVSSQVRSDALQRFNMAISAGAETFAPEETDNIRQTLSLADRYYRNQMVEDADRLYLLSSQKCRLLYRTLVLSKVAAIAREPGQGLLPDEVEIAGEPAALDDVLRDGDAPAPPSETEHSSGAPSRPAPPKNVSGRTRPARTTIYLTFDDGPSRLTLPIARFLKSEGVQATFFVLGSNIKGHEKAITSTLAMGHRIGNHTLSHNLRKLRDSFAGDSNEVKRTGEMIERLGGDGRMVRIPYGASGKTLISQVAAEGAQIFEWDINSNDSTQRGVRDHLFIEKTVVSQLNKSTKKHLILLFHDGAGHDSTLAALRDLIPRLKREGYRFGLLARSEKVAHAAENRQVVQ